jgi:hypothetical protein
VPTLAIGFLCVRDRELGDMPQKLIAYKGGRRKREGRLHRWKRDFLFRRWQSRVAPVGVGCFLGSGQQGA